MGGVPTGSCMWHVSSPGNVCRLHLCYGSSLQDMMNMAMRSFVIGDMYFALATHAVRVFREFSTVFLTCLCVQVCVHAHRPTLVWRHRCQLRACVYSEGSQVEMIANAFQQRCDLPNRLWPQCFLCVCVCFVVHWQAPWSKLPTPIRTLWIRMWAGSACAKKCQERMFVVMGSMCMRETLQLQNNFAS